MHAAAKKVFAYYGAWSLLLIAVTVLGNAFSGHGEYGISAHFWLIVTGLPLSLLSLHVVPNGGALAVLVAGLIGTAQWVLVAGVNSRWERWRQLHPWKRSRLKLSRTRLRLLGLTALVAPIAVGFWDLLRHLLRLAQRVGCMVRRACFVMGGHSVCLILSVRGRLGHKHCPPAPSLQQPSSTYPANECRAAPQHSGSTGTAASCAGRRPVTLGRQRFHHDAVRYSRCAAYPRVLQMACLRRNPYYRRMSANS